MDKHLIAFELKSYLFWQSTMDAAGEKSLMKQLWNKRDYVAFRNFYPVCPYCGGNSMWSPKNKDGGDVEVAGINIDVIKCFCESLLDLSTHEPHELESFYDEKFIDDIAEVDLPKGAAKATARMKTSFQKFIGNPTKSALIVGRMGSAKTHMLQALKTHFGRFAVYMTATDFYSNLMSFTTSEESGGVDYLVSFMKHAPILLFDDFGMQHMKGGSDWGMDALTTVIDYRYSMRRLAPTIVTTNLSLEELNGGGRVTNIQRMASRFIDTENATVFVLTQDDYRNKVTRNAMA